MKYKNIIFDFGNVLATFDADLLLSQFCADESDRALLKSAIFDNWQALDEGSIEMSVYIAEAVSKVPPHLIVKVLEYFNSWYKHLTPLTQTWDFIRELKANGYHIYILSNAPVQFAENASFYEIVNEFDGIVFSAPIQQFKPESGIYQYLFDTYHLKPEECFFIDDKEENIKAGQALGMDGIVFTGNIEEVKKEIDF
ncbi:MAG: HAD family phosphatase [Ruminococcus sp.]|nr:HAD family phosphatase [Ruminococcus sp.]